MKTKLLIVAMMTMVGFYAAIGSKAADATTTVVGARHAALTQIMDQDR